MVPAMLVIRAELRSYGSLGGIKAVRWALVVYWVFLFVTFFY